jgi:hypothetical protein
VVVYLVALGALRRLQRPLEPPAGLVEATGDAPVGAESGNGDAAGAAAGTEPSSDGGAGDEAGAEAGADVSASGTDGDDSGDESDTAPARLR